MAKRHIRRFTGELTSDNFDRVADVIFEDDIVALDLMVDRALFDETIDEQPSASCFDNKIVISRSTLADGGIELNINDAFSVQWGTYRIDGIFLIKSGGMFQGVTCLGLIPTDEAQVRLNPEVQIVDICL